MEDPDPFLSLLSARSSLCVIVACLQEAEGSTKGQGYLHSLLAAEVGAHELGRFLRQLKSD